RRLRELRVPALREEDPFGQADGDGENAGDDQQREGPDDRVKNPTLLAHRFPCAEKKSEIDRVPAVGRQCVEQADQGNHAQRDGEAHDGEDGAADQAAAGGAGHCAPPAPITTCLRTISRATTFSASVTRNSSSAISISDASISPSASEN